MADLQAALDVALPATYVLSVGALVAEHVLLRAVDHPMDRRGDRASVLSGLLAFGLLGLANRVLFIGLMHAAWALAPWDLGLGPLAWLATFLLYDLMFYVAHRAGHEIRLLWCFHSVHHTAEQMRLTTAIRGSALDFVYLPWFFVWIPLVGIHPSMVLIVEVFGRLWGVATHISPRFVGRLPVEGWLVTPSMHRVHHGRNRPYLDTNYGEVLPLWDRLLGTYVREVEEPDYGVLSPVDAGSLAAIQLTPWRDLWRDLQRAPNWRARLRYLLDAPGWSHDGPDSRVRALRG